ncbi:hypothetical protein [Martelella sp. AD-3]|uniref:helix-turn-helix transcriptional regulator n=1 Tax=Martelella sp. AD-3 TaxID=686597 RepID=UPI0009DD61BB|nr:hypothetical protein [Martelella sp. AD-3]
MSRLKSCHLLGQNRIPGELIRSPKEEATIVAFHRHTLLPLDDCLYALQPRMMTKSQAARYCGLAIKRFPLCCPVAPVAFGDGTIRYGRSDLDRWIESKKAGCVDTDEALHTTSGAQDTGQGSGQAGYSLGQLCENRPLRHRRMGDRVRLNQREPGQGREEQTAPEGCPAGKQTLGRL